MLSTEKVIALTKWIKEWNNTYGEFPSIEECVTWVEWQFESDLLSNSDIKSIKEILQFTDRE